MRYRANTPSIIFEVLDGEVVILSLDKGIYYSLSGIGTSLWEMVISGLSASEIESYFNSAGDLKEAINGFIDELLAREIIVADETRVPIAYECKKALTFAPPILHVHEDMKELLLLDPIHEVDQMGWPAAR